MSTDDWLTEFVAALAPLFVFVHGKILVAWSEGQREEVEASHRFRPPTTAEENTNNHYHAEFVSAGGIEARTRANHCLAESIAIAWRAHLAEAPTKFTLFVCNEYQMVFDGESGRLWKEDILPTVRLWTHDDRTAEMMDRFYQPRSANRDRVFWPQRDAQWFDLSDVAAFMELPPDHPTKTQIVERYHSDPRLRHQRFDSS